MTMIPFKGLYFPNFFKKTIFGFVMFFDTLNYGESPYVIYFCCLEPFMLLFFIDSLEGYSLATDIAMSFTCFKPQYYTRKFSFYLFSMAENPVKTRITESHKNPEKQTLSSGLQNR